MVSARALSWLSPTLPTEGSTPASAKRSVYLIETYWLPRSLCVEIAAGGYNAATDCPAENCVVAQVKKDVRTIADHQLAKPVRAEALRFLIHFVGDLHQPLHCADNRDRGGNEVAVVIGTDQPNLHAVWDTDVVAALGQDPGQTASALEAQMTPKDEASWGRGAPADWANESFGVAKRVIYAGLSGQGGTEVPIIFPRNCAARMRLVTATQLERAGVRHGRTLSRQPLCGRDLP
jgi:hypothetical protein